MKCPNCGAENEGGMKFCGECGTPIPQEKKCPACEVEACIHIANENISEAENVVGKMKRFFPQSVITKCVDIFYLCEKYKNQNADSILNEIQTVAGSLLQDSENKYEQKLIKEAKRQAEHPEAIFCKYTEVPDVIKNAKNVNVSIIAEGNGNNVLKKISNALKCDTENGKKVSIDLSNCTEGVEEIEEEMFFKYRNLKAIDLPNGLKKIGVEPFGRCSSFERCTIPEGVEQIDWGAFYMCKNLKTVKLPEGLKIIGEKAFYECSSLEEIIIPEGVKKIEEYAFLNCTSLRKVILPKEVLRRINNKMFSGCPNYLEFIVKPKPAFVGK